MTRGPRPRPSEGGKQSDICPHTFVHKGAIQLDERIFYFYTKLLTLDLLIIQCMASSNILSHFLLFIPFWEPCNVGREKRHECITAPIGRHHRAPLRQAQASEGVASCVSVGGNMRSSFL